MKWRWSLLLFLFPAIGLAAEESMTLTISDTPPIDRVVIDPLTPANKKMTKYEGTGTLYLDGGSSVPLIVKRWTKAKKGAFKYRLKTPKGVKPKFRLNLRVTDDFVEILKLKVRLKLDTGKVKQKDPTKGSMGPTIPPKPLVPDDILAVHNQDLAANPPDCLASGCHEDRMTQYAPHKDSTGADVENFHYLKARLLSGIYFGGRTPDQLTAQDCTVCHKRVKLLIRSGANGAGSQTYLRRIVDTSICAGCHGPGTSKPLYLK